MSEGKPEQSKVSSFIKGSSILVLSNVCLKAINFFLLPLYTHHLTPSMIGISDSVTTLTGILLPLLTMGLDSAFSAFYFEKSDPDRAGKVFSTLTWAFLLIGCVPLLLMPAAQLISELLFHTGEYSYIIRFALISVSFNLWFLTYSLELRLQNKMFLYGLSNVIASLSMVLLNILFVAVLHLGESSLVLSTMIVHIENLLVLLLFVKTKPQRRLFDAGLFRQMMRFALPLVPMTLMMWVLSLSDRYVLLQCKGDAEVGLYGIGLRFTNLMNVVISAVSVAYTTFAFSSREDENAKRQYYYIYNIESFLLIGIAFTVGLFGREIVQMMTAESYARSYLTLRDLMFSQAFYAMASIVGYGIYFAKKSGYSLIAVSAGAVLNLGLNLLLIPRYGMTAAALTTLLGYALHYFLTLHFSEKLYPCDYGQKRVLLSLAALYAACFAAAEAALRVKVGLWCACFAGMVLVYRDPLDTLLSYGRQWLAARKKRNDRRDERTILMIQKLLYLTYIPLEEAPTSGSSVRPQKMRQALEGLGVEVKTFGGIHNNIPLRRDTVARVKNLLAHWRPDACYIEPPSGPLFYWGDVALIRKLHRMGIPTSIFYRDAYWKYPTYSAEGKQTPTARLKRLAVKGMQTHQWNVFRSNIDLIYFPSETMAREFDCPRKDTLPPGGFLPNAEEKTAISQPLQFIFVGGAHRDHGTFLTIEAFARLNAGGVRARLFYICPRDQWEALGIDGARYGDWLEVIHTSGDENLKPYYERSDAAILAAPRTFYRDFAVPIKIFEYMSYGKPMLVTDCTETARIVRENRVGWVTKDDPDSVERQLAELCDHPEKVLQVRSHMDEARRRNLWASRAEKVLADLAAIQQEKKQ